MPTYDYECAKCGQMEIFQSMREDALTKCPECGSKRFSRLISGGAGVIFKGEGFWETDYNRSADYAKQAKAESSGATTADSAAEKPKAETKAETKPAEKAKPASSSKKAAESD